MILDTFLISRSGLWTACLGVEGGGGGNDLKHLTYNLCAPYTTRDLVPLSYNIGG